MRFWQWRQWRHSCSRNRQNFHLLSCKGVLLEIALMILIVAVMFLLLTSCQCSPTISLKNPSGLSIYTMAGMVNRCEMNCEIKF